MNLIALHDPTSSQYLSSENGGCIACHGEKSSEPTLSPTLGNAHHVMFLAPPYSGLSGNARCAHCHTKNAAGDPIAVDVISARGAGNGAALRKQVDPASCVSCHCTAGGIAKQLYANCQ